MSEPEAAIEQARAAAAAMRASGAYGEDLASLDTRPEAVTTAKLLDWALVEPELEGVRSTRPLGAPITALKRLLLRLLGQYHAELLAQQTRFNVGAVSELCRLEERLESIERKLSEGGRE